MDHRLAPGRDKEAAKYTNECDLCLFVGSINIGSRKPPSSKACEVDVYLHPEGGRLPMVVVRFSNEAGDNVVSDIQTWPAADRHMLVAMLAFTVCRDLDR